MSAYSSCDITEDGAKLALTRFILLAPDDVLEDLLNQALGEKHFVRFRISSHPGIPKWDVQANCPIWE